MDLSSSLTKLQLRDEENPCKQAETEKSSESGSAHASSSLSALSTGQPASTANVKDVIPEGVSVNQERDVEQNYPGVPPSPYQYRPLTSPTAVRLIKLLPGKESDPICCSLSTANLEDAPPFEALSYVWGDPRDTQPIFCFDHANISQTKNSTLQVTVNCWHALRRLRFEGQARTVWIDAICINQQDLRERDRQVGLMGDLYRKAICVLVYLGHDEDHIFGHTSQVFELFRSFAVKATSSPTGIWGSAFEHVDRSLLILFVKFFERPWFKRCWTMQEIGLARRAILLCDGDELEWDVFFSVICWIDKNQPLDKVVLDLPINELATSVNLYTAFEKGETSAFESPPDFLDVLNSTRSRHAGEPKDRIYAFLGHATAVDEQGPLVVPYYSQWNWIVFYQFTLTYLQRTHNLRILSAVDHGKKLPPTQFPLSWIPWWNPSPCKSNFGMVSALYDASAGSKESQNIRLGGQPIEYIDIDQVLEDSPLVEWEDLSMARDATDESVEQVHNRFLSNLFNRGGIQTPVTVDTLLAWHQPPEANLSVRGLILDEVKLVWPVLDREDFTMNSFSDGRGSKGHVVESLCDALHGDDFTSRYEDPLLALSLTLVASMHVSKPAKEDLDGHKASFAAYRHVVQTSHAPLYQTEQELRDATRNMELAEDTNVQALPASGWENFMIDAVNACHHRRFFTTTSGFFGLGPESMLAEGVFCAILFGARAPFILQKIGDTYRLVGEAYIHGVMNGEAIEMWKRGELEEVDIQIF